MTVSPNPVPADPTPLTLAVSGCYRVVWSADVPDRVWIRDGDTGRLIRNLHVDRPELFRSVVAAATAAATALERNCPACHPTTPAPAPAASEFAAIAAQLATNHTPPQPS